MTYSTGLSETFLKQYSNQQPAWGPLGYVVYKRTYARPVLDRTEEWWETCARVCNSIVEVGGLFTEKELEQLYTSMFNFKGLPAGRILWQLGSQTVKKLGADSLVNCWVLAIKDLESFTFVFDQLLLGGGVGFNILPEYVYELPPVKYNVEVKAVDTYDCDFIVPDNREGWVELLRRVLLAFFVTGKNLYYSPKCVRPAGQPMFHFGGYASGARNLMQGITNIVKVLKTRIGNKLRPIDAMDIINILGVIGINSGAKRTSQMALGDGTDPLFMNAKNRLLGLVPNWRAMSNNSVVCNRFKGIPDIFWDQIDAGDSYGLVNLNNCRRFGRLVDGEHESENEIIGVNPCSEFLGANKEPCDLADLFLPNIQNEDELIATIRLMYKVCKTITNMDFIHPETNTIVHKNHKIGIGLTGWMAATKFWNPEILNNVYKSLQDVDEEYSRQLGCGLSKKLTVIKPSGTLSLLPACISPGMHAAYSRYMIRRVRFGADDPLVELCHQSGYSVEPRLELDGSTDSNTMVVSFPVDMGPNAIVAKDISVIDELEQQRFLQTYWADQSISCTHYYKREEIPTIKAWLQENYDKSVKTCSFMLAQDHKFLQAPLEEISEEQYNRLKDKCKPITCVIDGGSNSIQESLECSTGGCPVR